MRRPARDLAGIDRAEEEPWAAARLGRFGLSATCLTSSGARGFRARELC
jgi:hypothetical protein